ncbi:hypothetical protein GPN2_11115 [Streptomyces murinus]
MRRSPRKSLPRPGTSVVIAGAAPPRQQFGVLAYRLGRVDPDDPDPGGHHSGESGEGAGDRGQRDGEDQGEQGEAVPLAPGVHRVPASGGAARGGHLLLGHLPPHPPVHRAVEPLLDLLQEGFDQGGVIVVPQIPAGPDGRVEVLPQLGVALESDVLRVTCAHALTLENAGPPPHWGKPPS